MELGQEPTDSELAAKLGWSEEEARFATRVLPDATSLERPDDGVHGVGELVADEQASRVAEEVVEEAEMALLFEALGRLPERERYVLLRRHGLDGDEPATLREIAEELGVSRERVRQLQREAERRLRRPMTPVVTPVGSRRVYPPNRVSHVADRPAGREARGLGMIKA